MNKEKLEYICRGHLKFVSQKPASLHYARLYKFGSLPIAVENEDKQQDRTAQKMIFGSLTTVICDEVALKCIDGYIGCSLSFLNTNHKNDLFHRFKREVYPIEFSNINDFFRFKYKVKEQEEAYVYIVNKDLERIKILLKKRHNRCGFFYHDFLNIFNKVIDIQLLKW